LDADPQTRRDRHAAIDEFIRKAVGSFANTLTRMNTKPEDVMPWKVNGEKWHLGEKGFPPGRKLQWTGRSCRACSN